MRISLGWTGSPCGRRRPEHNSTLCSQFHVSMSSTEFVIHAPFRHSGARRNLSNVYGIPACAGMTELAAIHISMNVRHSSLQFVIAGFIPATHLSRMFPLEPWVPATSAGMTVGIVFHLSMSAGHSFAGGENGYAVSGAEKRRVAWTQALARMPVVSSGCDAKSAPTLLRRFLPRGRSCRALDRTVSEVFR